MLTIHLVAKKVSYQADCPYESSPNDLFSSIGNSSSTSRFELLPEESVVLLTRVAHPERVGSPSIKHVKWILV